MKKTLWFYLSRRPRLLWQPDWFPEWEKKKKAYFWTLSWNTHVLALSFLNIIKENWENAARNVFWAFLVYLQMCFCFFPKQWDFQTKRTGTLLWVSWLFSVHVSLAIPLFKQRLLYVVYEVELRANIITVSCSELTPTKPPSAVLQQDFMSSCSPAPEVWLCPSSAQSSESLDSTGQDCERCCSENTPCLTQSGCTAEIQVLCLGSAQTFSGLQSQKKESSS